MKIIDLTEDKKDLFCLCLEDGSDEAKEAGPKRRQWLDRSEKLGLRAKLVVDYQWPGPAGARRGSARRSTTRRRGRSSA